MNYRKYTMGPGLREIRKKLGLTLKDVEMRTRRIAETRQNPECLFTAGRLSQVEKSFSLPSLYKLASLSEVYRVSHVELLGLYGIELNADGVVQTVAASAALEKPARQSDNRRENTVLLVSRPAHTD